MLQFFFPKLFATQNKMRYLRSTANSNQKKKVGLGKTVTWNQELVNVRYFDTPEGLSRPQTRSLSQKLDIGKAAVQGY